MFFFVWISGRLDAVLFNAAFRKSDCGLHILVKKMFFKLHHQLALHLTYTLSPKSTTPSHYFGPKQFYTKLLAREDGTPSLKTPCRSSVLKSLTPNYFSAAATTLPICDFHSVNAVQLATMAINTRNPTLLKLVLSICLFRPTHGGLPVKTLILQLSSTLLTASAIWNIFPHSNYGNLNLPFL